MDVIVEHNETFTVSLSTESSNDEISPNTTLVTIQDDDGMWIHGTQLLDVQTLSSFIIH